MRLSPPVASGSSVGSGFHRGLFAVVREGASPPISVEASATQAGSRQDHSNAPLPGARIQSSGDGSIGFDDGSMRSNTRCRSSVLGSPSSAREAPSPVAEAYGSVVEPHGSVAELLHPSSNLMDPSSRSFIRSQTLFIARRTSFIGRRGSRSDDVAPSTAPGPPSSKAGAPSSATGPLCRARTDRRVRTRRNGAERRVAPRDGPGTSVADALLVVYRRRVFDAGRALQP